MSLRSGENTRSRSPPLQNPRLRRAKRRRRSVSGQYIRMYYRTMDKDSTKSFLLNIPISEIELCNQSKISHNHTDEDSIAFPTRPLDSDFLSAISQDPDKITMGYAAIIDSTVYACYYGKILTLDLDSKPDKEECEDGSFGRIPTPPSFPPPFTTLANERMTPKLIALRGLLFFFGGNCSSTPFGEVYDPSTNSWSQLNSPEGVDPAKCLVLFKASLGEFRAEILFYGIEDKNDEMSSTWIHIYHVDSGNWRTLPSTVDFGLHEPVDWRLVGGKAIVKEEDNTCTTMYWLDRRGRLHAFNWETLQVSHGRVIGFDHEDLELLIDVFFDHFSFFHVSADLFCLAWSQDTDANHTAFHITFLRIIDHSPVPGSLTAHVVNCIKYTADCSLLCFDAFPI